MTDYKQIDCDSHIQEVGDSWELYLAEAFKERRPRVLDNPYVSHRPKRDKTWYIDGRLVPKNQGNAGVVMSTPAEMSFARSKPVPITIQGCTDPLGRAAYMKQAGIHRTVMFTTVFLETLTDDLVYEAALMRAWNTWLSEMCKKAPDHLAYGALVPIRDTRLAIQEMVKAKELGAAAVMLLPAAGDRHLHDPLLDPFWAEAQSMGMPVAVHIGWPNPRTTHECTSPCSVFLGAFETSLWWAYLSFFAGGILDRFPALKVAFFEHDARWFELFLARAVHWYPTSAASPWPAEKPAPEYLKEGRVFFSFEGDYSYLPHFLTVAGEDAVMAALDFPHTHYATASLSVAFDLVRGHERLTDTQKRKLLRDNAGSYYGFKDLL